MISAIRDLGGRRTRPQAQLAAIDPTSAQSLLAELQRAQREIERLSAQLTQAQQQYPDQRLAALETLFANAPVGVALVDPELRIRHINEVLAAVNGASVEDHLGKRVSEMVPGIWPQLEPLFRSVLRTGAPVINHEVEQLDPEDCGRQRVWLASYHPVWVGSEMTGIGAIVAEITDRMEADEFRATVLENMAEGLYVLDREGRVMMLNNAAATMLGYEKDELLGKSMHATIHFQNADGTPHPEHDCQLAQAHREGHTIRNRDDAFTRKDGTIFPVAYSAAPLCRGEKIRGAVIVFRDVAKERAEQALVQRELERLTWVGRVRDALDEDRMVLYSQKITALKDGSERDELLVRMLGRGGETILPGEFLPTAEKYGLVTEIDRWVLGRSVQLAATGRRVHVNVSAESVAQPGFLQLVRELLQHSEADPACLIFEITETAVMRDLDEAAHFARYVSGLGCRIALDDFGTGFGSLTYLKRLPIDYLKIDKEFVVDLVQSPTNQHLVKAIVNLAQGFGQETIAEGVEDEETLELLRAYDVDFAQGFHVAPPAPVQSDATVV